MDRKKREKKKSEHSRGLKVTLVAPWPSCLKRIKYYGCSRVFVFRNLNCLDSPRKLASYNAYSFTASLNTREPPFYMNPPCCVSARGSNNYV